MTSFKHEVGKCDICHQQIKGYGSRGYLYPEADGEPAGITRYCEECWAKEEGRPPYDNATR
jgi:hypothetical protein